MPMGSSLFGTLLDPEPPGYTVGTLKKNALGSEEAQGFLRLFLVPLVFAKKPLGRSLHFGRYGIVFLPLGRLKGAQPFLIF